MMLESNGECRGSPRRAGSRLDNRGSAKVEAMIGRVEPTVKSNVFWFAAIALAIYVIERAIVASGAIDRNPAIISAAIAFDLIVVVPFLYWLFVVRPRVVSLRTLLPVVLLSLLGARLLLPAEHRSFVPVLRWLLAPLEI